LYLKLVEFAHKFACELSAWCFRATQDNGAENGGEWEPSAAFNQPAMTCPGLVLIPRCAGCKPRMGEKSSHE